MPLPEIPYPLETLMDGMQLSTAEKERVMTAESKRVPCAAWEWKHGIWHFMINGHALGYVNCADARWSFCNGAKGRGRHNDGGADILDARFQLEDEAEALAAQITATITPN